MKRLLPVLLLSLPFAFMACFQSEPITPELQTPKLPPTHFDYLPSLPEHMLDEFNLTAPNVLDPSATNNDFIIIENSLANPPITNAGATLGRVLFYDKRLSINNATACASCHIQERAFSDFRPGSIGFEGKVTPRNSMAIINVALNRNLFWDSRVHSAKELILHPIQNHIEMGMEDLDVLVKKLAVTPYYPPLFAEAYGDPSITPGRIADAMAQFLCSMVSTNSKFDQGVQQNFANFNELEKLGMQLFQSDRAKCSQCHANGNFSAPDQPGGAYSSPTVRGSANTGLDIQNTDPGFRDGQFRIPSLRNIALTAPYMHDGRFQTLEEVIDFYDHGIQNHPNLDPRLRGPDGEPIRLHLSSIEKKALVAFLHTLTDQHLITDEKFSNPFD